MDGVQPFRHADRHQPPVELGPFAGRHHARYIDPAVPYHVVSRVFQGRHLLRPCAHLNRIILGVLGRALEVYPDVQLFACAFMSNHMHLMVQAPPDQLAAFVGFVKREISRRWGGNPLVDWPGTMWCEYLASALPTPESQVACLKYVLSQGVKEGLVAKPQLWPGVHCARYLLADAPAHGEWFDATAYSRALDAEHRKQRPRPVPKGEFYRPVEVRFAPIPAWAETSADERRTATERLVRDIETEGRANRGAQKPVGARVVRAMPLDRRRDLPSLPWFEDRRRMICWADRAAPEVREYLNAYWSFQRAFRTASEQMRSGRVYRFPDSAFTPGGFARAGPAVAAAAGAA